jgi:hypothetical protein
VLNILQRVVGSLHAHIIQHSVLSIRRTEYLFRHEDLLRHRDNLDALPDLFLVFSSCPLRRIILVQPASIHVCGLHNRLQVRFLDYLR